jgi:hypothetical protein
MYAPTHCRYWALCYMCPYHHIHSGNGSCKVDIWSVLQEFHYVKFQVLMAASMKVITLWDIALCSLGVDQRMEATCTSETSVNFNMTTWCYIPEDSKLQFFRKLLVHMKPRHLSSVPPVCDWTCSVQFFCIETTIFTWNQFEFLHCVIFDSSVCLGSIHKLEAFYWTSLFRLLYIISIHLHI